VNPHVVPFISGTRDQGSGSGICSTIMSLVTSELRHRINQAEELGLMPHKLDFLTTVSAQNYRGHVTIVPHLSIQDYVNLLANPTIPWIKECMLNSERNTWEILSMIKHHCAIELVLDKSINILRKSVSDPIFGRTNLPSRKSFFDV